MNKDTVTSITQANKCYICYLRLTVSPIMKANSEKPYYRCGRCKDIYFTLWPWSELSQFDDIAQHMTFPCSFPPCKTTLPWARVQDHENKCSYRTFRCPLYGQDCVSSVRADKVVDHFKETHNHNIETTGVIWNGNILNGCVNLLVEENENFFVYLLKNDNSYYVGVFSIERTKYTNYNLKVIPASYRNFEFTFNYLPMIHYEEKLHCYGCVKKECKVMHHPYSFGKEKMKLTFMKVLDKDLMTRVISSEGYLRYSITLIRDETSEVAPDVEVEQNACNNIKALVRALNCPYCMTYITAPIFTCTRGHTICNACRSKMEKCPTCLASFGETRNYALEELFKDVSLPCQYKDKGCTFTGTSDKIIPHELECPFNNSLKE